jgi:hypothetical protein
LGNTLSFMHSPVGSRLSTIALRQIEKNFQIGFPLAAKESHVAALSDAPVPEKVIAAIAHLNWRLVIANPYSFVLTDVGPVYKIRDSLRAKSAPVGTYEYAAVFLPISGSHVLAGLDSDSFSDLDVEQLNSFSINCSESFFISGRNTLREQNYALQIGSSSELLDDEAMTTLIDQILVMLQTP